MSRLLSTRNMRRIGRVCAWVAASLLVLTVLTGYGISQFRIVSSLTFGILDKVTSHRLHHYTDIPLLVFLSLHVAIALYLRLGCRSR